MSTSFEVLLAELEGYRARTRHSEDLMRRHFRARQYRSIPVGGGFTPGPDGVFWRWLPGHQGKKVSVVLADNKAYSRRVVGRASALQATSLAKNLPRVIATAQARGVPHQVIDALRATLTWARSPSSAPGPPSNVRRVVTNACGRSEGVSPGLAGIEFQRVTIPCRRHLRAKVDRRELELAEELEAIELFLES